MADSANLEVVSATDGDRVLSGVGVEVADLEKVMERHAEKPIPATEPPPASGSEPPVPPAPAKEPSATAPATTEKPSRGQKRFDDLTREREEANRAAQAAQQEAADLRKRLEAVEQAQQVARQAPAPIPQPMQPVAPQLPPIPQFPPHLQTYEAFLTQFPTATYDDWNRSQMAFIAQDARSQFDATIRQSFEADRASRSFQDRLQQTWSAGKEVYPDFEAMLTSGPGSNIDLDPRATAEGRRSSRIDTIFNLPNSPHVQYAISRDADLAKRLANAGSDLEFGLILGQIAPSGSVASPASTAAPVPGTPPPPYQPVGSGSKTTTPSSADLVQGFDYDASGYRERRAAERGMRRR